MPGRPDPQNQVLVPFHWVKTTSDPEAVNMVASMKDLGDGLKVFCLSNSKAVQPETLLLQASKELLKTEEGTSSKKRKKSA